MNIKEIFVSFTGQINVGKFAYFIDIDEVGIEMNIDDIVVQAQCFSHIVFTGEPFKQKEELAKLIKKIIKVNPNVTFEIFNDGLIRPIQIGALKNIIYNINVQLKSTGLNYDKRINDDVVNWFNEIGANFLFDLKNNDDIDETHMLVKQIGIPKNQVYLSVSGETDKDQLNYVLKQARIYGYNFTLDYRKLFWSEIGKVKE